jgi:hypothetical protein
MTSSHSRFTGVLNNIPNHFLAICEYPIILVLLFTSLYSWAVLVFFSFSFLFFSFFFLRFLFREKWHLKSGYGTGAGTTQMEFTKGLVLCDLFNLFLVYSVLVSVGNGEKGQVD